MKNYSTLKLLHKSQSNITWLGVCQKTQTKVILKTPTQNISDIERDICLRFEYDVYKKLSKDDLFSHVDFLYEQGKPVLVRKYIEGVSLELYLKDKILHIEDFFTISISLCKLLGNIHRHQIIHNDINPLNIIYNPVFKKCYLIDFDLSSGVDFKLPYPIICHNNWKELHYISPEHTGRINRPIDYRSDFYSLGVTFYEMLTGQLPFNAGDFPELMHAHIAKEPIAPNELRKDVPPELSAILFKLLAKNAEERYQSIEGLQYDLEEVHRSLVEFRLSSAGFIPGRKDFPQQFKISQKLYGRSDEMQQILQAFKKAGEGAKNFVLIKGNAGIGKSSLVAETRKSIITGKGIFLEGKFDQHQQDIPYLAWRQVLHQLASLILSAGDVELEAWRTNISSSLGANGKIITDLCASFELIIGEQKELPVLDPDAWRNQFNFTLKKFIASVSRPESPLVIFMDDWQWADLPSISLLRNILSDVDSCYLLMICAIREPEVKTILPFEAQLTEIKEELRETGQLLNVDICEIQLKNLVLTDVETLLFDTLGKSTTDVSMLAALIYNNTKGNAYYITQKLQNLYNEKLLQLHVFDDGFKWEWDTAKVREATIGDNVIDLILNKFGALSLQIQEILIAASCIGNDFYFNELVPLFGHSTEAIYGNLLTSVNENFIQVISNKRDSLHFRFVHDKIRQAIYELNSEEAKYKLHYKIGEALEKTISPKDLFEKVFDLVDHFNKSLTIVVPGQKQYEIARYNLIASQKAKSSAAYLSSLKYAQTGIELLIEESWTEAYRLTYDLHMMALQGTCLTGSFDQAEFWINKTLKGARGIIDQSKVYELQIDVYTAHNKFDEILALGMKLFSFYGMNISKPLSFTVIFRGIKGRLWVKNKTPYADSVTGDELADAVERIMVAITPALYYTQPKLILGMCNKVIPVKIKTGNTPYLDLFTKHFIRSFGSVDNTDRVAEYRSIIKTIRPYLQNIDSQFTAKYLLKNISNQQKLKYFYNVFINYWTNPLNDVSEKLHRLYRTCFETGNFEYAGLACTLSCQYAFYSGRNLQKLIERLSIYEESLRQQMKNAGRYYGLLSIYQPIAALANLQEKVKLYDGSACTEELLLKRWMQTASHFDITSFSLGKMYNACILQDYKKAIQYYNNTAPNIVHLDGTALVQMFHFAACLLFPELLKHEKGFTVSGILYKMKSAERRMKKWAALNEANFLQKYYLVKAERCLFANKKLAALANYNQAIQTARKNNHLADEALAQERLALFYLNNNQAALGQVFLQNAYSLYDKWGATAKCMQLKARYPQYIHTSDENHLPGINSHFKPGHSIIDLLSVIKNAQAIAVEIMPEKLLEQMLEIAIQHVGAEKGLLLLYDDHKCLRIQASIDKETCEKQLLQNVLFESSASRLVPGNIINYVSRLQKTIVLDNAMADPDFSQNEYIQSFQVKSVLCIPLLKQQTSIGVLYLENNLATHIFTTARIEFLSLLSSQMAIAIENVLLHENLDNSIKLKTRELEASTKELRVSNEKLLNLHLFKENMTKMIAHDLKNPLNLILNLTDSENGEHKLIHKASRSMHHLVLDMLDIHALEEAHLKVNVKHWLIKDLIARAINDISWSLQGRRICIEPNDLPGIGVNTDGDLVNRVLVNLLLNAVIHQEKSVAIRIKVEMVSDKLVKIMVIDSGTTIPDADAKKIFDKFYQASPGLKKQSSGLGLTFCKLAMEALGQEIGVLPASPSGNNFWFTLPVSLHNEYSLINDYEALGLSFDPQDNIIISFFRERLQKNEVNQLSEIVAILQEIHCEPDSKIFLWKNAVRQAAYKCDEKAYAWLIHI